LAAEDISQTLALLLDVKQIAVTWCISKCSFLPCPQPLAASAIVYSDSALLHRLQQMKSQVFSSLDSAAAADSIRSEHPPPTQVARLVISSCSPTRISDKSWDWHCRCLLSSNLQTIVNCAHTDWQVEQIPQQFYYPSIRTVADDSAKIN